MVSHIGSRGSHARGDEGDVAPLEGRTDLTHLLGGAHHGTSARVHGCHCEVHRQLTRGHRPRSE
jgi:hypothetical protein